MEPLFSIITINFNNHLGLEKTIRSITSQSYSNYEFIIIDGGSSDIFLNVIKSYEQHITFWCSEKDKGIYDAQNKGIEKAKGQYLVFMNSGDCFSDNKVLEDTAAFIINNNGYSIYYGNTNLIDDDGTVRFLAPPEKVNNEFFYLATLNHQSCFIDKELFKKFGLYNLKYKICADYEFFLKVFLKDENTFKYFNKIICDYENYGISADKKLYETVITEKKQIQNSLLSQTQLKEANRLIIQQEGRKSKFFKKVPNSYFLKYIYDKSFFYWYKMRSNAK